VKEQGQEGGFLVLALSPYLQEHITSASLLGLKASGFRFAVYRLRVDLSHNTRRHVFMYHVGKYHL